MLFRRILVAMSLLLFAAAAPAATFDVLWVSGSPVYNANVRALAAAAPSYDPAGDGAASWSLTVWDHALEPSPGFGDYDVLVIGSTYAVDRTYSSGAGGASGFFGNGVSASGILANRSGIEAARGTRTLLTGLDPDWHDYNNRPDQLDGPEGFLINAVNWAASGQGLGIVSLSDRYSLGPDAGVGWWTSPGSFLADELSSGIFARQSDLVYLGPGQENFPVNEGLSSSGLSGWNTSAHAAFLEIDGYEPIAFTGPAGTGFGVTIVTQGQADAGTSGAPAPVPLPAPAAMLLAALALFAPLLHRRS